MTDFSFPLDGPIQLVVRIGHGSVTVLTEDDLPAATVRLNAGKHAQELLTRTVVEMHGRALNVVAPRQGGVLDLPFLGKWSGRGLDVEITVPTRTPVKISTYTAPIRIPGLVGDADLAFGAGEAAVRDVDGDLRVRFGSGTVKAVHVSGSVQLRSGSGNAQLGEVGGALACGCGNGDLAVRIARGPVRARSGSGSARLAEVHGDVDVASGAGEVEIGLPAGLNAQLDLQSGSGQVRSELPVDDRPGKGTGNGKPIRLRARTGSGDVRLFRAA
ncbi:MAG TPA: DUF4097 family beta strand repeat-containing protein [Jatrophihabitans sp.]|nr:DUF4097 family beta strand repeat-containing protein [Jatrophihabitans sp.]